MTTKWRHDCDRCIYIGAAHDREVYYCPGSLLGSWLARYGDEPWEYASYPTTVLMQFHQSSSDRSKDFRSIIAVMDGERMHS